MNEKKETRGLVWLVVGVVLIALAALVVDIPGLSHEGTLSLAILLVGIIYWATGCLPVPVTAMAMVAVIPLFGIMSFNDTWAATMSSLILFLVGTFGFTVFIKHSSVAQRLIAVILRWSGTNPKKLILGFMIVSAAISTVMSNIALAAVMMALVHSLLQESGCDEGESRLGKAMAVAVPWAVVIGSMLTPCGGPINLMVIGMVQTTFGIEITFAQWVMVAAIPVVVLLIGTWLAAVMVFRPEPLSQEAVDSGIRSAGELPPMPFRERANVAIILITLVLWIAGSWVAMLNTTSVALLALSAMFIPRLRVIKFDDFVKESPWGLLLMLMAVNAIVAALTSTGTVDWLINVVFGDVAAMPWLLTLLVCSIVTMAIHNVIPGGPAVAGLVTVPFVGFMVASGGSVVSMAMTVAWWSAIAYLLPLDAVNLVSYQGYKYLKFGDMAKCGWVPTVLQVALNCTVMPLMCSVLGLV
ncbi:SLC13 family permease [Enterorhabdus sp. P55]|uniref:SLC13 family permease n=1 Tax=Enterorhabdus sp. P55 TaxID=2304571 RepID=UPI001367E133|nr:SLC13 family permease [Enterorhabdus sp. P55]NBI31488.1 hypothetical protein [Enterorhabdus sp. P55]